MATKVTPNIFSGRRNPTWVLNAKDERKLTEQLSALGVRDDGPQHRAANWTRLLLGAAR